MFLGRARFLGVLAALLGSLALAGPASAGTTSKPYSLNISPGATTYESSGNGEVASGETVQVTATFTNETSTQQMGSANLFWPSGFAVLSSHSFPITTTAGSASLSSSCTNLGVAAGPCVQVRNLSAAPGSSVTVTMWVSTPACQQGSNFAWSAEVKQANNYSGSPGNDFSFDAPNSQPDTTLDGACSLRFVNQPADARVNEAISDQAFNPPPPPSGGDPVTVQVLDSNGNPLTSSSVPVSMSLSSNPGLATLGGTTTEGASGGTASFADLSINVHGSPYELGASSGTLTGASSNDFAIQDQAQFCANIGGTCTTTDGTSNGNQGVVQATVNDSSGVLTESVNTNGTSPLECAGYTTADPNNYEFNAPSSWSKVITITIIPTSNLGNNQKQVLKNQQICFEAPYPFMTNSGAPATQTTFPDGTPAFIGLLPDCGSGVTGPCHDRKSDTTVPNKHSKTGYNIVLVADVPPGEPGDPRCG
jgi:hypothetical protein